MMMREVKEKRKRNGIKGGYLYPGDEIDYDSLTLNRRRIFLSLLKEAKNVVTSKKNDEIRDEESKG